MLTLGTPFFRYTGEPKGSETPCATITYSLLAKPLILIRHVQWRAGELHGAIFAKPQGSLAFDSTTFAITQLQSLRSLRQAIARSWRLPDTSLRRCSSTIHMSGCKRSAPLSTYSQASELKRRIQRAQREVTTQAATQNR